MGNANVVGDLHRLIVFDLDGTLIDSRRDLADSANELITELGGRTLPDEAIARMVGEGAAVLVRRALSAAGLSGEPPDSRFAKQGGVRGALERFLQIYDTRLLRHTRLYPGIREAVEQARTLARVAVLTNKPTAPSERILDGLGVRALFDEVVGGDGPVARKPDPAGLQALMQSANASAPATLMVGDSAIDHETAIRAGVRCCLVSYGFGFENFPRERLRGDEIIAADAEGLTRAFGEFCR